MNREKFISYWLSRSYAPRVGDNVYEPFLNDIASIFEEYAINNVITVGVESAAYIGKIRLK